MRTILVADENPGAQGVLQEALGVRYKISYAVGHSQLMITAEKEKPQLLILNNSSQKIVDAVCSLKKSSDIIKPIPLLLVGKELPDDKALMNKLKPISTMTLPIDFFEFTEQLDEIFVTILNMRDEVTGCYKKACIEEKIRDRLKYHRKGTMFLINIDSYSFASNAISAAELQMCVYAIRKELGDKILLGINGDAIVGYIAGEPDRKEVNAQMDALIKTIQTAVGERQVYTSIGVAMASEYDYNYDDLYLDCDRALGFCRSSGKNCCRFYR